MPENTTLYYKDDEVGRCLEHPSFFSFLKCRSTFGSDRFLEKLSTIVWPPPCGLKAVGGFGGLPTPLISTASVFSEVSLGVLGSFKLAPPDCLTPAGVTSKAGPGKSRGATSFGFPLFKSK